MTNILVNSYPHYTAKPESSHIRTKLFYVTLRGYLPLHGRYRFRVFSSAMGGLRAHAQPFRFPDARQAVALLRVTAYRYAPICDPTGNRTPIAALRRRCPNR